MAKNPTSPDTTDQRDDNIDEYGRRPDGSTEDQPGADFEDDSVEAEREEKDTQDNPNPSPMNPAFP